MARTQIDLYRSGSSTSANLHKPRLPGRHPRPEIETFPDPASGDEWVKANTGGPSVSEAIDPDWSGRPHKLLAGAEIPDELILTPEGPSHWLLEPSRDMPFADYVNALETVNGRFGKV
jgi:hypothetical protein